MNSEFLSATMKKNLTQAIDIFLVAAVYTIIAKLGLSLAVVHESASTIWPATGFAVAILLLFRISLWPGILLGAFFANVTTEGTVLTSILIALGNTLEATTVAHLANLFAGGKHVFERSRNVITFSLAAALGAMISATVGVLSLSFAGFAQWSQFGPIWLTWWLGDLGGAMIIAPLIIIWARNPRIEWTARQTSEYILVMLVLIIVGAIVFGGSPFPGMEHYPIAFLVIPVLVWIAVRFTQRESILSVLILSIIAIWGTFSGAGPFVTFGISNSAAPLFFVQGFLTIVTAMSLVLATVVAERRQVETALRRTNQAKNDFIAVLAHELRNPLSPMLSYVQLMQLPQVSESEKKEALSGISLELKHMTRLLDDLLDVARITRGRVRLQKEAVDIRAVITRAIDTVRPFITERRHALKIDLPSDEVLVELDPFRIEQVIVNLLNNAAKYTDPEGEISISCVPQQNHVLVLVRDTGMGIAPEMLHGIFSIGGHGQRPTANAYGGLGIGLRLVKILVDLHGGNVAARSEGLGKGSTFIVRLPYKYEKENYTLEDE